MSEEIEQDYRNKTQNKIARWTFFGVGILIIIFVLPIFWSSINNLGPAPCTISGHNMKEFEECVAFYKESKETIREMKDLRRDNINLLKDLFFTVLPVFSAWIGAVLAFYYGTDTVKTAVKEARADSIPEPKKTPALQIMIKTVDIQSMTVTEEDYEKKTLHDIVERFSEIDTIKSPPIKRLPLLTSQKIVKAVADRYVILTYIYKTDAASVTNPTQQTGSARDKTLKEFYNESCPSTAITKPSQSLTHRDLMEKSIQFADKTANTDEIYALFQKNQLCHDIFITENGGSNEPILGWIRRDDLIGRT